MATIGLVLTTTACGPEGTAAPNERQAELRAVQASYDGYFQRQRPDHVVITVPETVAALTGRDESVFRVIKTTLAGRKIPYECRRLDDMLTVVTARNGRKKEHLAYRIPPSKVEMLRGGVLLYINLLMVRELETKRHPVAVENDITVRVWNDPLTKRADSDTH